jgi:hypothetical protein
MPRLRISLLHFPPFIPAPDFGVTDALNMDGYIGVHLASPLNSFRLGRQYCTGPFRTRLSYRKVPLFALFDKQFIRHAALLFLP